jgi:putative acetyltransferase
MMEIRKEKQSDREAIHQLNMASFDNGPEANLVDKLRASCRDYLSFVAIEDGAIVGHLLFTPVTVEGCKVLGMGLGPMAVLPSHQRRGIGSQLVKYGLAYLHTIACPYVIVLGHPEYYPRFGFEPASKFGLASQWEEVPDEAFMVIVFDKAALPAAGGTARYRDEFNEAM